MPGTFVPHAGGKELGAHLALACSERVIPTEGASAAGMPFLAMPPAAHADLNLLIQLVVGLNGVVLDGVVVR